MTGKITEKHWKFVCSSGQTCCSSITTNPTWNIKKQPMNTLGQAHILTPRVVMLEQLRRIISNNLVLRSTFVCLTKDSYPFCTTTTICVKVKCTFDFSTKSQGSPVPDKGTLRGVVSWTLWNSLEGKRGGEIRAVVVSGNVYWCSILCFLYRYVSILFRFIFSEKIKEKKQ